MFFHIKDKCPRCGAEVQLSSIEMHETKPEALHNYHCPKCGPVLVKVYDLKLNPKT
jgi:DNA-directed RNA polymerase subunit RPC12/RpoP